MGKEDIIEVYTDGACKGNPGPGGWGWAEFRNGFIFTDCGGEKEDTTNNRMELMGLIQFLEKSPSNGEHYIIHIDNQYVLKGIIKDGKHGTLDTPGKYTGWMKIWIAKNFKNIKNVDLWTRLDKTIQYHLKSGSILEFKHVSAHKGNFGNELADSLANTGVPK